MFYLVADVRICQRELLFCEPDHVQNELVLDHVHDELVLEELDHMQSRHNPVGDEFRILGCLFDCKLLMTSCIHETVVAANWKMRSLLRIRRFYSDREMINL